MGLLDTVLGSLEGQQDYSGFVNRYQQGPPDQGYSGQEVMNRYQQVAPALPNNQYEQAAMDAVSRLSPQQRQQFGEYLLNQARQQNIDLPPMAQSSQAEQYQNPSFLASLLGQFHQQEPGLLGQVLSGGNAGQGGGILENPMAKAVLAGIAAMAVKKMLSGRQAA